MKDSGIPWIGQIPEGWEFGKYKFSGRFVKGKLPLDQNNERQGLPIIGASEMLGKESRTFTLDSNVPTCLKDDILVLWDGANAGIVANNCEGVVSSTVVKYTCTDNDFNKQYLFYLLKNAEPFFKSKVGGTTIPHMSSKFIDEYVCLSPPIAEQEAIAEYLDRKCGEVDEMVALQEQVIQELKAYKQSIITEAVTKGLNPNTPMKPSGINWIGEIPEHWDIMPIKHFKSKCKNAFVDGPFGSNLKSSHYVDDGDVYVVESGFITTGKFVFKPFKTITNEHFRTINRSECKAFDIIIAKIGANYGMAGELPQLDKPSVVSGNSLKITLDNDIILNSIFVYLMMSSKCNGGFNHFVQENAQPALSLSGLNNFRMPVPPLSEQREIADYLDRKCADIDALIALKQQKIEDLKEYKKSLIYEYVTGKKEVSF